MAKPTIIETEAPELSPLARIEAKRAARKAAIQEKCDAQKALDLEAVNDLEEAHGDSNIVVIDVPFTEGLPTLVAGRCPTKLELKRYRARVQPRKDGKPVDAVGAAEEIASVCQVYPEKDTYALVLDARPGLHVQLGLAVLRLATGKAEEEGKD